MKRIIISMLITAMVLPHLSAMALLEPTGEFTSESSWFASSRAEVKTEKILRGNIAFAIDSDNAWNIDKLIKLPKKCYMDESYNLYIPTQSVKELFGINASGEYISHSELQNLAKLEMYFDPMGLVLFSKSGENIPQEIGWADVGNVIGELQWNWVDFSEEERVAFIRNWQKVLTIPDDADRKELATKIEAIKNQARLVQETIWYEGEKGPFSNIDIWSCDVNSSVYLARMLKCYENIFNMAKWYFIDGGKDEALRNDILTALEFLYENHYSNKPESTSKSWTVEQFVIPYAYSNTLCLMYDDMTQEDRVRHCNAIFERAPDPTLRRGSLLAETQANLVWKCYSFFNTAIMAGDVERMNYAMKYIAQGFFYTPIGFDNRTYGTDGFYKDGSMLFHSGHAYNLGYGTNYLSANTAQLLVALGSRFDVRNIASWKILYELIITHYLPFIQENILMRMVKGRNLPGPANTIVAFCAVVMNYAPEPYKTEIARAIKTCVGDFWPQYEKIITTGDAYGASGIALGHEFRKAVKFINSIGASGAAQQNSHVYYNMDRVIHRMPSFTAALAMSSQRVYKLETLGGNNTTGWYTGDGMLYMYIGNGKQHSSMYTTKVNPYHMPGTTVDSTQRPTDWVSSNNPNWGFPDNLWAGAATDGMTTMATYEIGNKYVSTLKGKKSYFMLNDKVVCVGSGITGGNGRVYTTVENFFVDKKGEAVGMSDLKIPIKSMETTAVPGETYTEHNTFDGDTGTAWASETNGVEITYEVTQASGIAMAFDKGARRHEIFRVDVSEDGQNFHTILDTQSNGTTTKLQYFPADFKARYVKIVGFGNSTSAWFSFSEFSVIRGGFTKEYIAEVFEEITIGYEDVYIDDEKLPVEFNKEFNYENARYAYIPEAGGYVFGKGSNVIFNRETYGGSVQPFATILLNHGENPVNASYAYTLLPKATAEETKSYAENPTVEVLSATPKLHLLYDKESGIYAASVFAVGKAADMDVKTPCTLIKDTKKKTVYVADPTHRFKEIKIILPKGMKAVKSDGVKISGQEVRIDISKNKGATYSFSYTE